MQNGAGYPRRSGKYRRVRIRDDRHIAEPELQPSSERRPTILMIDDDAMVLRGLKRIVATHQTPLGWLTAPDATRALNMLERKAIDIVLTDIRMVGMDGWQLLSIVGERYPQIVRVATSSFTPRQAMAHSQSLGVAFLPKPTSGHILRMNIDVWLSKAENGEPAVPWL